MNPLHPTPTKSQPAEQALGDLLRNLSTCPAPASASPCISAEDFRIWFLDRFGVAAASCSAKEFGDAIGCGIRYKLIKVEKTVRTKAKRIFYTGIDRPTLETLCERWSGAMPPPQSMLGEEPCSDDTAPSQDDLPVTPWDAGQMPSSDPEDYLAVLLEELDLNLLDEYPDGVPADSLF